MPDIPERAGGPAASTAPGSPPAAPAAPTSPERRATLSPSVMVRRRLLEMLATSRPLTVVSAPAGYGKSTLVESWLTEPTPDVTIVRSALEDDDVPPGDFWPSLVGAFRTSGVSAAPGVPGDPGGGGHGRAKALAADIAAHGRLVVWILDCGEFSLSAEVGREVDRLVRAASASLATTLLTRNDPPSALHRYRLAGALCEIRAEDLAFTASEVAALMKRQGVELTPAEVSSLRTRTGGWPAGLLFAAMSLQGQPEVSKAIEDFRGDTGNVAEYLMSEVLERQPSKRRRFLLRSCIAEELDPPLVEKLTGQHCDVHVLEAMADGGCFVERIPGQHDRFRYHSLFRQFLRAQLSYEKSPPAAVLHRMAAEWLARDGQTLLAVRHAVAATDWALATEVLVDSLGLVNLLSGHGTTALRRLLVDLPPDLPGAEAGLTRAAVSLAELDGGTAGRHLEAVRASTTGDSRLRGQVDVTLAVLTAVQTSLAPDTDAALDLGLHSALVAEKALRLLPAQDHLGVHPHLGAVVAGCKGRVLFARGEFLEARDAFQDGVRAAESVQLDVVARQLKGMCALVEAVTGHLRRAAAIAAQVSHTRPSVLGEGEEASEAARLALAWVRADEAEPALAHELVAQAQRSDPSGDSRLLSGVATLLRARMLADRGELRVALAELRVGQPPGGPGGRPRGWLARTLLLAQADTLTRLGRPQDAIAVINEARDARRPGDLDAEIVLQQALLAAGAPDRDPGPLVTAPGVPLDAQTPLGVQVGRWLVLAEGSIADQDLTAAAGHLDRALRLAASEHLRRPILQAPQSIQRVLRDSGLGSRNRWLHTPSEAAGSQQVTLHIPAQRRSPEERSTDTGEPVVIPLTKKETEVLGYLAKLLTTDEIAAVMFVSVNTVRSHVRSILRKLGVSRRNEAVRRAWELHLLPPGSAA